MSTVSRIIDATVHDHGHFVGSPDVGSHTEAINSGAGDGSRYTALQSLNMPQWSWLECFLSTKSYPT